MMNTNMMTNLTTRRINSLLKIIMVLPKPRKIYSLNNNSNSTYQDLKPIKVDKQMTNQITHRLPPQPIIRRLKLIKKTFLILKDSSKEELCELNK